MSDIARYRSRSEWEKKNPVLRSGEPGFEDDTGKLKIGDGVKRWNMLPYQDVAAYTLPKPAPLTTSTASVVTPSGSYLVMATEDPAVAAANPQYAWLILGAAAAPADTTPPVVPTGLTASPGDTKVILDWTDVTSDLDHYEYRMGTVNPPTGTPVSTGTTSTVTLTGLVNGTGYWFQVRAVDAAGNPSSWSTAASATPVAPTTPATVPDAPTGVTATGGDSQATINWTAPASNGGEAITDYVVQSSSDGGTTWVAVTESVSTATTATATGLVNGTAYVFRVAAVNAVGTGSWSTASSPVTPTAPAQGGTTPMVVGRNSGTVSNVGSITVPIGFTPQPGDDVFFVVQVPTGSGNALTVAGFESTAVPANTSSQKLLGFYRRFQAGDDPATMCHAVRPSGNSNMHGKVVVVRGLDPAAANLAALRAVDSVVANAGVGATALTLGPTGTPSQARVFGQAFVFTNTAHGGGLTASAPYTLGGTDTNRSSSASAFITDGTAQTVTIGWATANEAHGILLVLKAAP